MSEAEHELEVRLTREEAENILDYVEWKAEDLPDCKCPDCTLSRKLQTALNAQEATDGD